MEKEMHPDSLTTVTIKPEYPPSEIYSSEPPPAYTKAQNSVVQVAKIIAVTLVLMSVILGSFLLASAYVTATATCKQMEQEMEMFNDVVDRLQLPSSPEALVQAEPLPLKSDHGVLQKNNIEKNSHQEAKDNDVSESNKLDDTKTDSDETSDEESEEKIPILIKLPLQLDFDEIAGSLLEKNQKSRMNCVVEKKRSEETIDHKPKTLNLPFGINITTNPRSERLSGERLAIFCESGNMQSQASSSEDDQDNESVMIQPIMLPFPPQAMIRQMQPVVEDRQFNNMRPPIPVQENQSQLPPNHILHQIAQQIIAHNIVDAQKAFREQNQNVQPNPQFKSQDALQGQNIPIPAEILQQLDRLPNHDVIVAVSQQEYEEPTEDLQKISSSAQEFREIPQTMDSVPQQMNLVFREMKYRPFPNERDSTAENPQPNQQTQNTQRTYDKESYVRLMPVQDSMEMNKQEQKPQSIPLEVSRPHYVHPRSVRSVDAVLPKSYKRVKRCSCDCAC